MLTIRATDGGEEERTRAKNAHGPLPSRRPPLQQANQVIKVGTDDPLSFFQGQFHPHIAAHKLHTDERAITQEEVAAVIAAGNYPNLNANQVMQWLSNTTASKSASSAASLRQSEHSAPPAASSPDLDFSQASSLAVAFREHCRYVHDRNGPSDSTVYRLWKVARKKGVGLGSHRTGHIWPSLLV